MGNICSGETPTSDLPYSNTKDRKVEKKNKMAKMVNGKYVVTDVPNYIDESDYEQNYPEEKESPLMVQDHLLLE